MDDIKQYAKKKKLMFNARLICFNIMLKNYLNPKAW